MVWLERSFNDMRHPSEFQELYDGGLWSYSDEFWVMFYHRFVMLERHVMRASGHFSNAMRHWFCMHCTSL